MNEKLGEIKGIRDAFGEEFGRACVAASACFAERAVSLAVAADGSVRGECREAVALLHAAIEDLDAALRACGRACDDIDAYLAWT